MNYRHGFHAGNHADVLKHLVLVALLDALKRKDAAFFVLDTHAGRGRYDLRGDQARRTGEAASGFVRLREAQPAGPPALRAYLEAVAECDPGEAMSYPGSPLLVAHALRDQDRLAACELQPDEAAALKTVLAGDPRCHVHNRDGYAAVKALLPPREGNTRFARGLVLIDPPYEVQEGEYAPIVAALREGLERFPQGIYALWYPIKRRATLQPLMRKIAALPARSALTIELLVRPDDSPLRMNGSGMLILNPPWQLDAAIEPTLRPLAQAMGEAGASWRLTWLKQEPA
ncbi:MAG: 23S rRNA (adenine(2030)-N(6))-methyltransferase RlmJ [Arenimonas sp. SCN 70-307]|mgnify:CR=1 FL=1|uniref:23S rRNA (adenine(2030)-N(6))-methyltransferase RlmJ n=1 Tax=Arenimonas sp. SCN 70-307 TaxID=1660089 RepID=UPI00086A97E7|nr:23S rRNA (adenine(2030)-N(6))-methyltransferase RlmJ [Arenimonas sp. SCN 70-307]ODS64754.1 MAG: 23S rRNA (adenine(2030)-N(6))-methyltransferase RlmJ [Arenimonas sp. SCN 70-307]